MIARRLKLPVMVLGCVLAGAVGLMVAPALALAAPITPVLYAVSQRTPETVTVLGVLNLESETEGGSEGGIYEFLYKESASGECEGADHSLPVLWSGSQAQFPEGTLSGLKPGKTYAVCLRVENSTAETAVSKPFTVTTAIAPEVPTGEEAKPIAARSATLHGVLNPGAERTVEPGNYEFVYSRSSSECQGPEEKTTSPVTGSGAKGETVEAPVAELLSHTQYTFCLRESNEASPTESVLGAPVTFTTPAGAPRIEAEFTSEVASTSATLHATINPEGAETSYVFESAPVGGTFAPVVEAGGEGDIPEGAAGVPVSVHVQKGLVPGATYEFRVVTSNSVGSVTGGTVTFTNQHATTELALPDGRQYEMVSPLQKEGALFLPIREGIIQAAADGNAFTDESAFEPIEDGAAGAYGFHEADFFGRGPGGWVSKTITPPHPARGAVPLYGGQEYRFFSEDLSEAILQPFGPTTPLAPGVSESTPYIHTDYLNGDQGELCGTDCFQPLVTEANVPAGTKYGEEESEPCKNRRPICGPEVVATSPDLSHVLISSDVALTAGSGGGRYEWVGGKLTFITTGRVDAISDNGSLVIDGSYEGMEGLLLHDAATGETIRLDVPQGSGLSPVPPGQASFQAASADVSRVFFTSEQPLVGGVSEPALYEYNLNAPAGSRLTDISADENSGEAAGVSSVLGTSNDGSYVYFAASGVLAQGATPAKCDSETPVCMNLYVHHDGTTTFVAGLGEEDYPDWIVNRGDRVTARVSPNGQWLAFMSNRDLTGYDTDDAVSDHPDEEVYLYGASAGKLVCASCDPTGSRPVGVEYGESESRLVDGLNVFPDNTWIAANVPPWTDFESSKASYQSRYLSDSGRLFFDSGDALVSQDVNGTQDVYQYEPHGVGSCTSGTLTFSERSDGCVDLVSSGESAEESTFLDASETGGDVFFLTSSKLVGQDTDNAYDIYDARECGSPSRCLAPESVSPPPCDTGDSCKPASTPQPAIFGSPSSATFSGAGNVTPPIGTPAVKTKALTRAQQLTRALKACREKKRGKRRNTCERQARARYGAKKARKANAIKRSGR
ncbi:MAG TPA: hypothetical protein VHY18_09940 [Solirubrobacteraceae bacterium]|jgi:hypothetical protein|nr:hypothetical protein [Solirubrobacteraceae bacterium]